ncbi:hypothetical protein C7R88_17635 (plasmid) [Plesiomonas shigelloides]|uniref:type 4 pilus major pilin n=1 Tax=Plesiomonas shigelloides TaxID=703 RepID=UPI000D13C96D|nr:type 4 pilus major pilin [Plesiomonas shigelloides]AVQ89144.1 hypothetical protein C7R88_17635 [Plesiomonas shigelloides]
MLRNILLFFFEVNMLKSKKPNGFTLIELLVAIAIGAVFIALGAGTIKKAFNASDEGQLNSDLTGLLTDTKILKDAKGYGDGRSGVNLIPDLIGAERLPTTITLVAGVPMNSSGGSYTLVSTAAGVGYEVATNKLPKSLCISAATTQAKSGIASTIKINSSTFSGTVSRSQALTACNQTENTISFVVNG